MVEWLDGLELEGLEVMIGVTWLSKAVSRW